MKARHFIQHEEKKMIGGMSPGGEASMNTSRTRMQQLLADIEQATSPARANLEAVVSQRMRLLGDVPPSPVEPRVPGVIVDKHGESVSFDDISRAVERLHQVLMETNEHVLSMRRIG